MLGTEPIATAERLELEMLKLEARVLGKESSMVGPVRITMPPHFAVEYIDECRRFSLRYPDIQLELVATHTLSDMSKREADIAVRVRSRAKIPEHLVGRFRQAHGGGHWALKTTSSLMLIEAVRELSPCQINAYPW